MLVEPVSSSAASLLVRNLSGNPVAKMLLVLFSELGSPARSLVSCGSKCPWHRDHVLLAGAPAAWVLVYERSVQHGALFNALFHPEIGLDVFFGDALVALDKVLKDFRVGVG